MNYECRITVLETKVFPDLQEKYLADPKSGPCPCFKAGDTFLLKRTPEQDDFYRLMNGKFCGEAWDAISRYVYAALQGGSIMRKWTNDDRMMIACCNDGTRPVIFKIERIDIPENEEESSNSKISQPFDNTITASREAKKRRFTSTGSKVVSMNGRGVEVYVIKPQDFAEAQTAADLLKEGRTVVINLEGVELTVAQRSIDFVGGATYAINGSLQAVSNNIFIAAPDSIEVSGDLKSEIMNENTISPQLK